jgi:hypothetical protein
VTRGVMTGGFMRRLLIGVATSALCLAVAAPAALGAKPEKTPIDESFSTVSNDICPFPVQIAYRQTGHQVAFTNDQGELTRLLIHVREQDVFTGPTGRTLSSVPYRFNLRVLFGADGQPEHVYATGVVLKVPLPGGKNFHSAGRLDFVTREGDFAITPDVGRSGDVAAFCAALAG